MFRITRPDMRALAIADLLEKLRANPKGLAGIDLPGTRNFHGSRTLSPRQCMTLLRESGQVSELWDGNERYGRIIWRIKE